MTHLYIPITPHVLHPKSRHRGPKNVLDKKRISLIHSERILHEEWAAAQKKWQEASEEWAAAQKKSQEAINKLKQAENDQKIRETKNLERIEKLKQEHMERHEHADDDESDESDDGEFEDARENDDDEYKLYMF